MKKVVIYGAGVWGRMLLADVERYGSIEPAAITMDREYMNADSFMGLPIVPWDELQQSYPPENFDMLEICGVKRLRDRLRIYEKVKATDYRLINYISPGAILESEIEMGDNNVILTGAWIGFDGKMGSGNMIRQNVYLGHEFNVGSHNIISVGCTFGSHSHIGDLSFFGLSVTAPHMRTFGDECLIGMGSVVTKDVEPYAKAYGNPARVASYHQDTGVLL